MSIVLVRAMAGGGSGRATGGAGRGAGAGSDPGALFPGASSDTDRGCESVAELFGASGS